MYLARSLNFCIHCKTGIFVCLNDQHSIHFVYPPDSLSFKHSTIKKVQTWHRRHQLFRTHPKSLFQWSVFIRMNHGFPQHPVHPVFENVCKRKFYLPSKAIFTPSHQYQLVYNAVHQWVRSMLTATQTRPTVQRL